MIDFSKFPKIDKKSIIENDKVAKMLMLPEVRETLLNLFLANKRS